MPPLAPQSLLTALHWRYATKAFDPQRTIPAETWAGLVESVVLAPSSFGLQPYRLLDVRDRAVRESLVPHAWGQQQVVDASHFVVFAARTSVTEPEIDTYLRRIAEVRGVTVESLAGFRGMLTGTLLSDGFRAIQPNWTARQAYIALGTLLESAALLGVDACPMEGFVPAEFDRILGLRDQGLTAVVACALGYRAETDRYAQLPKVRFATNDLVRTI